MMMNQLGRELKKKRKKKELLYSSIDRNGSFEFVLFTSEIAIAPGERERVVHVHVVHIVDVVHLVDVVDVVSE